MNSDLLIFGVAVPVLIVALVQFAKILGLEDDKKKASYPSFQKQSQ